MLGFIIGRKPGLLASWEQEMFKTNVGGMDKKLRIAAGVLLLVAGILTRGEANYNWIFLIGIVPLATGLLNTCPLYNLLGINTCKS